MTISVLLAVLFAAFCHASWNALVKFGNDRLFGLLIIAFFSGLLSAPALLWVGFPPSESIPWLALSTLFHIGYTVFLSKAYSTGDLSQIYPISRGTAPLMVAALSIIIFNHPLSLSELAGILLIITGVLLIALVGKERQLNIKGKALIYALITTLFTACYTLADGQGARAGDSPLSYTLWLFFINGLVLIIPAIIKYRTTLLKGCRRYWKIGIFGGLMQLMSYGIVIWAMSKSSIVLVAALRETSVLFAMFLSIVFLKEHFSRTRIIACVVILGGVLLAKMSH